ncbi:MAG: DnaJ domain-containing protein [Alphaproteobacteria bacterium]|nr:DnaJ domain-containing protein [Alphaproteobacteria bacterium]
MLGFLVLIFIYLFVLLAQNTEKPARSSLVRSLMVAALFIVALSLFSIVTFGVLFFFLFFVPFFFFPSTRFRGRFHGSTDETMKDFFEQMRKQQQAHQNYQHHESFRAPSKSTMSMQEAASLLGINVDATPLQIKSAYRKLMLKHHPDKGGSAEHAAKLNVARDTLMTRFESH